MKRGNLQAETMIEQVNAMTPTAEFMPEEMQVFLNLSRELLCITDIEGNFLKLNPSWQSVLGWNLEELRSHSWQDLIHPDDLHRSLITGRAGDIGQVCYIENRYRHKTGKYCWLSWRILHRGKGLTYAAAQEIHKPGKNENGRAIMGNFSNPVSGVFSQNLANLNGGSETGAIGETNRFKEPLNQTRQAFGVKSASLKTAKNPLLFFRGELLEDPDQGLDTLHSPSELLSRFEGGEGFSSLDEQSPSPLAIAQLEERLLKVNVTLCEMLGDTDSPSARASSSELSPGEALDTYWHKLQKICGATLLESDPKKGDRSQKIEPLHRGQSSCAVAPPAAVQKPLLSREPEVWDRTTSDRPQREDAPGQINAKLEQRVRERTAELQAANQELEAFCYSVSHDLRSPLRAIRGFAKAVIEDYHHVLDETGKDYLHRVYSATQRMNQLIDDLMSLSRVTRTPMQRKPVNLSEMARTVATELHATQRDRQVRFKIADSLMADGDPHLLQVMLDNLLNNAWKFTSKTADACIEFGVSDRPLLSEGKQYPATSHKTVYFVRDNGAGFNMTYADKLFAPFQRLHNTTDFEGTGIGLATVSRIVQRHGGQVWAIAEVDHGAAFYFTL